MSFVKYTGLHNPNEVLTKIAEYVKSRGYEVADDLKDDLNIYDMGGNDGKRFVFKDRSKEYFICLRSCNGVNIFGTNDDSEMDVASKDEKAEYSGIGMIVSEGYSKVQRWYNQYNIPLTYRGKKALGAYIPIPQDKGYTYTLWCNNVTKPTDTLVFTVEKEGSYYKQVVHLVVANLDKYDEWDGGIIFSGSANQDMLKSSATVFDEDVSTPQKLDETNMADSCILPVLSSGIASNSFLRIDIDDAPSEKRGKVLWACSGTNNETGKPMSLPVRVKQLGNGDIPSYRFMQSKDRLDAGRNFNTLNALTIAMPTFVAVRVDPDAMNNYAPAGVVSGFHFVSTINMQTSGIYKIGYPSSATNHQVFPFGKRRGAYGFDGFSIKQET